MVSVDSPAEEGLVGSAEACTSSTGSPWVAPYGSADALECRVYVGFIP